MPSKIKLHESQDRRKTEDNFLLKGGGGGFGLIFFGGLNQKSAMISICKIHIYIDSESFRQIH